MIVRYDGVPNVLLSKTNTLVLSRTFADEKALQLSKVTFDKWYMSCGDKVRIIY